MYFLIWIRSNKYHRCRAVFYAKWVRLRVYFELHIYLRKIMYPLNSLHIPYSVARGETNAIVIIINK